MFQCSPVACPHWAIIVTQTGSGFLMLGIPPLVRHSVDTQFRSITWIDEGGVGTRGFFPKRTTKLWLQWKDN
jgi:hypothetical protein